MTRQEFLKFAAALKTFYPREQILPNDEAIALWHRQLMDLPYETAVLVLNKWVATEKFSPTIADIRSTATEIEKPVPDWSESWEKVMGAVRKFGMYRENEALESLDDLTRECVTRMGFWEICTSEKPAVERANFRDIYMELANKKKSFDQMPIVMQNALEKAKQMALGAGKADALPEKSLGKTDAC